MKKFISIIFICFLGASLYALTLKGIWGNPAADSIKDNLDQATKPFELSPERSRFLLTQNLFEHNSFALSRAQADAASPDVGYYKGNYFIYFAPGISLFAIPFYNLGLYYNLSQVFTFAMIALFATANLIFIFLLSKNIIKLPYWASIFASLAFGFGSVALSYATTLYQHHATVFFILSAFYAAWEYKRHQKWGFLFGIFIWLNYALAISIDYPNAVLMFPVMIYFATVAIKINQLEDKFRFSIRPSLFLTSILFIGVMIIHGYYNQVNFGNWKNVSGSLIGLKTIQEQNLDQGNLDQNIQQLMQKKNPVGFLKETHIVNSSYELLIALDKGIFVFSPIFIFGFLGILLIINQKKVNTEVGTLMAIVFVNIFFYSSWGDPWGGWAFGPRYLIPAMAILAIFASHWLSEVPRFNFINKFLALVLFTYSAAVSLLGALTTNAVPPQTEAAYLKTKSGFFYNIDFLNQGRSGSFLYNNYFQQNFDLITYYMIILSTIVFVAFLTLFILPLFERRN